MDKLHTPVIENRINRTKRRPQCNLPIHSNVEFEHATPLTTVTPTILPDQIPDVTEIDKNRTNSPMCEPEKDQTHAISDMLDKSVKIDLTKDPRKGLCHTKHSAAVRKGKAKLFAKQLSETVPTVKLPNRVHKLRKSAKAVENPETKHPIPPEAYTLTPETYADVCDRLHVKFDVDLNCIKVSNIPEFINATRCTHLQEALKCNLYDKTSLIYTTRDRARMLLQ